MKTIQIEIPEGKRAEWVNGVLTLVDEQPPKFKFNVGDKVIYTVREDEVFTINKREILDDKPHYFLVDTDGISFSVVSERVLEPYTEPKDITERIKTFEDACEWCTENGHHNIRREYDCIVTDTLILDEVSPDLIAYLKLRIITCALNEGWEPKFERGEYRWYAWYDFLTNEELDDMTKEEIKERGICRVVGRASGSAGAGGGLVYSNAFYVSLRSYTGGGSRLAFRSEELAEYAAKQFIDIYADFCYKGKE